MANRTYLLNTPTRISNIAALSGQWSVVAEACDCVPLPWLCMFDEADLRPCTITFNHSTIVAGEPRKLLCKFSILNPSTTVKAAREHLAQARATFETLAGDAETGRQHWQRAMAALDRLPHEYLTIDPTEYLLMDELKYGATVYAAAISSSPAALEAKRQIADIVPDARDDNFGCLDGGFYAPERQLRQARSAEDAKRNLELLARLDRCNLAVSGRGYEALPLDLKSLEPPAAFWKDAALLEAGARHVAVSHGPCVLKEGKKHYATSLANLSRRRVRVQMFGGFNRVGADYALSNYTKAWFTAKDFIAWYGVPADGWIQPGQTVADSANWGGSDDGFWAYWCENEDGERFIALAHYPRIAQTQESAAATPATSSPWQALLDSHRAAIATNTEVCRKVARDASKREVDFDAAGVQWLDEFLDTLHGMEKTQDTERMIPAFGAFLGECIIRAVGGEWALYDGSICVRLGEGDAVFPLNKVRKHIAYGSEGGDSVRGLYEHIIAMMPHPLTARQKEFMTLYQTRSDYRFFVLHKHDDTQEWASVTKIDRQWVTIETTMTAGFKNPPTVSLRLDRISGFRVTDAAGMTIDSQVPAEAASMPAPPEAPRGDQAPRPTEALPPDVAMESAIARLRSVFADHQKFMNERSFESVRAPSPSWIKPSDALSEIFKQQYLLLREGSVVWGGLIQANSLLFSPGDADCPAQLVYSRDPHFDPRPLELTAIARKIFRLKNTAPNDPDEKAVADRITDEMDRTMDWPLPDVITDKDVHATVFMVFRRHIPNGVLSASCLPILIHPATPAVMVVPCEFWPIELIKLWKEGRL